MTIRQKIIVLFIAVFTMIILVISLITGFFFIQEIDKNEKNDTVLKTERALSAYQHELNDLGRAAQDYAGWDDTYAFISNRNGEYIKSNLTLSTFSTNRFYFMVFFNLSGDVVLSKTIDSTQNIETTLPLGMSKFISSATDLVGFTIKNGNFSGIADIDHIPVLIASFPILNSNLEGPAKGALVVGRKIDGALLNNIKKTIQLDNTLYALGDLSLPAIVTETISKNKGEFVIPLPIDDNTMAGYGILKDGYGKPVYILQIKSSRLYRYESIRNLKFFLGLLVLAGVIFCILSVYLLKRLLLNRLSRLHDFIQRNQSDITFSQRFIESGHDEFSNLANAFNHLLDRIEQQLSERKRMEEELVKANDALEVRVEERTIELMLANELLIKEITERKHVEEDLQRKINDLYSRGRR